VFAVFVSVTILRQGWWRAIRRTLLALISFAISVAVALKIMDHRAFHAISGSTTNRTVGNAAKRLDLFQHVLYLGGLMFVIAFIGLVLILWRRQMWLFGIVMLGSSWLPVAYHLYMREPISMEKHLAYGLFFAAPLAGVALAWVSLPAGQSSQRGYWLAGALVVIASMSLGMRQSTMMFSNWANTQPLATALHTQLRDGSGRIMAEDIEVARFDARDITEQWQWSGLAYLYYVDKKGVQLLDYPAIRTAIDDRYYDFIELSFNYYPGQARVAAEEMINTKSYDLIDTILFTNGYGKGHFYLFRTSLVPGHGDFKDFKQLKSNVWS